MVKRIRFLLTALLALIALAACASLKLPGTQSEAVETAVVRPDQPIEDRLAIGTLFLEGSDLAVTPEQAQALLPLWKAVRSLSSSETAAQEEIAAVYTQIQEAMTPEQIQAIKDMDQSPEETQALMEKFGIEMQMPEGVGINPEDLSEDERATRIAQFRAEGGGGEQFQPGQGRAFGRGQLPEGGVPGGAIPEGGPGTMPPQMEGTPMPGRGGFRGGFNLRLIDPLIELLQERAGS